MNPFEAAAFVALVACGAGVFVVERILGLIREGRTRNHQLELAEQQVQALTARVHEAERHSDELRQQLEWNKRLLEAQDRLLQHLGAPAPNVKAELPAADPATRKPLARASS